MCIIKSIRTDHRSPVKAIIFCSAFMVGTCHAQQAPINNDARTGCEFSFNDLTQCNYTLPGYSVEITLVSERQGRDEKLLTAANVSVNNKAQVLTISPDTSFLDGDRGYVMFTDINFDNVPDLAVTTSFGTPNLYLDYWVFDVQQQQYVSVGNYPKFTINQDTKTLSATIKDNAENYQTLQWKWNRNKLEKINP